MKKLLKITAAGATLAAVFALTGCASSGDIGNFDAAWNSGYDAGYSGGSYADCNVDAAAWAGYSSSIDTDTWISACRHGIDAYYGQ